MCLEKNPQAINLWTMTTHKNIYYSERYQDEDHEYRFVDMAKYLILPSLHVCLCVMEIV